MKKILIIFVLAVMNVTAFSQYQNIGSTYGNNMEALNARRAFQLPRGPDTTLNGKADTAGMMFYKTVDKSVWLRVPLPESTINIWVKIADSSGNGCEGTQSWNDAMTVSPDISSSFTSDFNGNDWTLNNLNNFIASGTGFIELSAGAGSILDLNPSGTIAFQSSIGAYNYSNLNTITNISSIATWSGSNLSKSTFSSVADSLVRYFVFGNTSYQWSVLDSLNTPPGSPTTGDIYEVGTVPTGVFVGHVGDIAEWNGGAWVFSDPTIGDLLYNNATDFVSKWTGSVWLRVSPPNIHQGGDAFGINNMRIGTNNNRAIQFETNNVIRFTIGQTGSYTYSTLTGSDTAIMGLTTGGVALRFDVDSFKATIGGAQGFQNVLDADPDVTVDNTVTGAAAVSFTWDIDRQTFNANDSIRMSAANDIGINSLSTVRILASTITAKAATATFGSNVKSIFHYETGVGDSIAIEAKADGMRFVGTPTGSTGSFLRRNSDGYIGTSTTVNAATELTGIVPVENGGTELATLTANNLIAGNGTSPVTFIAPGTSGNILTSNGTTWVSSAAASQVWRRAQYEALASTNIVQPTTLTDTVAIGPGMTTSVRAMFNLVGTAFLKGKVGINGNADASYFLSVQSGSTSGIISDGNTRLDGLTSMNTFATPVTGQTLTVGMSNTSNGGGIFVGVNQITTNAAIYGVRVTPTVNQTSSTSTHGISGVSVAISQSVGTNVSGYWFGVESNMSPQSTSATAIPLAIGFRNVSGYTGSATQNFTDFYAFRDLGISNNSGTEDLYVTYTGLKLDSIYNVRITTTARGIWQQDNSSRQFVNILEAKTFIGGNTTPTSWLGLAAGTTTVAPLKFTSGTDLTTGVDGSVNYDGSNLKLSASTTWYTIMKSLPGSATLDFPSTLAGQSADLTITVTGAADGDVVDLGVPNGSSVTNSVFTCWVSAANTVTVRFQNGGAIAQDPASGTFKVRVIK